MTSVKHKFVVEVQIEVEQNEEQAKITTEYGVAALVSVGLQEVLNDPLQRLYGQTFKIVGVSAQRK